LQELNASFVESLSPLAGVDDVVQPNEAVREDTNKLLGPLLADPTKERRQEQDKQRGEEVTEEEELLFNMSELDVG
jgi:hypothetical protein